MVDLFLQRCRASVGSAPPRSVTLQHPARKPPPALTTINPFLGVSSADPQPHHRSPTPPPQIRPRELLAPTQQRKPLLQPERMVGYPPTMTTSPSTYPKSYARGPASLPGSQTPPFPRLGHHLAESTQASPRILQLRYPKVQQRTPPALAKWGAVQCRKAQKPRR